MLEGRQKHRLGSHARSVLPWIQDPPWAGEMRTLWGSHSPAELSQHQQHCPGKQRATRENSELFLHGDTAGNAAATSGLLWARSGFLGWPTKTQHTKDPVLWTSVPWARDMLASSEAWWRSQHDGAPVSHWEFWDITPSTLPFSSVFPFPLLLTELCGYSQLTGLTSIARCLRECSAGSAAHWGLPWVHRTQPSSVHHKTPPGHTGLVKPQTNERQTGKEETTPWELLKGKDMHRNQVARSHSWLEFFLWAGRDSISSWAVGGFCSLSSLVATTGNQALGHDCTQYGVQNLLMGKYHHTDIPHPSPLWASRFVLIHRNFWARTGFTLINTTGTAIWFQEL